MELHLEKTLASQGQLDIVHILNDYREAYKSRQVSLLGRREVLTGKAKFGIFGDGKELPQLAMARVFQKGDIRSGYYRDQTFSFAKKIISVKQFFAQLYAHTDVSADPSSAGRMMNNHLATRNLDIDGGWLNLTERYNSAADMSCTASQMPRIVGLAQASKLYRGNPAFDVEGKFSHNGNEVVFGTIGDASCAEGHFWETINALGVIQAPAVISIWDDGFGISVPVEYQVTKGNISEVLQGFKATAKEKGIEIFTVKGWDYQALEKTYVDAANKARLHHVPCVVHVTELTQPQGHSTSGSHERYKEPERLAWEKEYDCLKKMREWILAEEFVKEEVLDEWEREDKKWVKVQKNLAWQEYIAPIKQEVKTFINLGEALLPISKHKDKLTLVLNNLRKLSEPSRREIMEASMAVLRMERSSFQQEAYKALAAWRKNKFEELNDVYGSLLYSNTPQSPLSLPHIDPVFEANPPSVSGFELLNEYFNRALTNFPNLIAFGEDVGMLGDVNQGFAGLQEKYGEERVSDTGIRESTIMGQAIGLALRGFRPIAEVQYLDYLVYGLQPLTDDLATLSYRTVRGQKAPAIIRTRGHRLEGIWHAGSPIGMILNAVRGIHLCVPRNMTQAAGMYQTLLTGDEPAIVIEVLNGYRLKEKMPENLGEYTVPLGKPEVLRNGNDITLATYGGCCKIALEAAAQLAELGIELEVIDVQTLLPFDLEHGISDSLKKTNRLICMDEDVPGGATGYMLQKILEEQGGYTYLDAEPVTISAKEHRCAYGTDGDYWSKPQVEHVFKVAYEIMHELDPNTFPMFF